MRILEFFLIKSKENDSERKLKKVKLLQDNHFDSSDIFFDSRIQIVSSGPIKKKVKVKSSENKAIKKRIQTKKRAKKS